MVEAGGGFEHGPAQQVGIAIEELEIGEFLRMAFDEPGMVAGGEQDQGLARRQRGARAAHDGTRLQPRAGRTEPAGANPLPALPTEASGSTRRGAPRARTAIPGGPARTRPGLAAAPPGCAAARAGPGGNSGAPPRRAMLFVSSLIRASRPARRSGVSMRAVSVSRVHSTSPSGRAAASTSAIAPAPPERTRSSGSWPSGKGREQQALARLDVGQREVDGAIGGAAAGRIAVEAQDRLVRHLPQQRELLPGQRGAERRDRRRIARSHHGDHVHIAFDRDHGRAAMGGLARRRAVVEHRALVEERRLRGVEVFGRRILVERAAAERHDPAGEIAIGNITRLRKRS